jgi:hypothetical protein
MTARQRDRLGSLHTDMERPDAEPFVLRLFEPEEALQAGTAFDDLIRLWMSRREGAQTPDWSRFDFADFRGWHEYLVISVFPDDEPDPVFRIIGEGWKSVIQQDLTGLRFSEYLPRLFDRQFREHLRAIRQTGKIGWSVGASATIHREFIRRQVIEFPVRRGGEGIDGLIHAIHAERMPD